MFHFAYAYGHQALYDGILLIDNTDKPQFPVNHTLKVISRYVTGCAIYMLEHQDTYHEVE